MARFYPALKEFQYLTKPPTAGEKALVNFLAQILDSSYEVFFQPHLNGDFPDVVIMREHHGVCIIEVKDWGLASYNYVDDAHWQLKKNGSNVRSPIRQVKTYKDNLYNYHVAGLAERKMEKHEIYGMIQVMVYLHNATHREIADFFPKNKSDDLKHTPVLGWDDLQPNYFKAKMGHMSKTSCSKLFQKEEYDHFSKLLQLTEDDKQLKKPILKIPAQEKLLQKCHTGKSFKLCGAAGSGKSFLLARAALDAYERTKKTVVILTFNITLGHYIHDLLRRAGYKGKMDAFIILHYHAFIRRYANNYGLAEREDFIIRKKEVKKQYKTIIVDEVQDFCKDWIDSIRLLVADGGQIIFAGDEKQNIYGNSIDSKKGIYTGIPGDWNKLKRTVRLPGAITDLANEFQKEFLSRKYRYEEIEWEQGTLNLEGNPPKYCYFTEFHPETIRVLYNEMQRKHGFHVNDSCIIADRVEEIRLVDQGFREQSLNTMTTFESEKTYRAACQLFKGEELEQELDTVRRSKKYNFWMQAGTVKLSTIHSFKGWEITNLILVLHAGLEDDPNRQESLYEMIYTALTRCRKNLVIVNIGNQKLDMFFREHCQ